MAPDDDLLEEARQAALRTDWTTVRALAERVLERDPRSESARRLRDIAAEAEGNLEDARRVARLAPLTQEVHRLTSEGWELTTLTASAASLRRRTRGRSGFLVAILLAFGILPGILYILWPRKDESVFVQLSPDGSLTLSGSSRTRRPRNPTPLWRWYRSLPVVWQAVIGGVWILLIVPVVQLANAGGSSQTVAGGAPAATASASGPVSVTPDPFRADEILHYPAAVHTGGRALPIRTSCEETDRGSADSWPDGTLLTVERKGLATAPIG